MSGDYLQKIMPFIVQGSFAVLLARYMIIVAYTIQVYDWLLCLSDEYLSIHKARWTSVKVAYLFCRYYPLCVFPMHIWAWVSNHPLSVCTKVWKPLLVLMAMCPMSAQAVFIMRTYAFAGRNKLILAFLVACWIALFVAILWIPLAKFSLIDEFHILFGDAPCFASKDSRNGDKNPWAHGSLNENAIFFLCTFLFDSLMTVIVFIQCIRFRGMWGQVGKAFVAQGLIAYLMLSALVLTTTMAFFGSSRGLDSVVFVQTVVSDVIACRLILMLRQVDPTHRARTETLRDAVDRLDATGNIISDYATTNPKPIELWD